jgi:hypothetical protein
MEYIGLCFIYIVCGIILGSVASIFFFRIDSSWIKIVTIGSSGGGYIFSVNILNKYFNINNDNIIILVFAMFLIGFILGIFVTFYLLSKLLKKQDGRNIVRSIDIFLGHNSFVKDYYNIRQREIDSLLNYNDLKELKEELDHQQELVEKREGALKDLEENFREQIREGVSMTLPIGKYIPITNQFINLFPDYIESYSRFVSNINGYTNDYINNIKPKEFEATILIKSYFLAICTFAISDLFGSNGSTKIRSHFRFLNDDNDYISLVATYGTSVCERALTPIPMNKGLISKSSQIQRSIIRSLNHDFDFTTQNHGVYEDYITLTFGNIRKNNAPFLTMGIAVKNKERYKNLMYFLNFCKFENIIQESIDRVGEVCDIVNIINVEYEKSKGVSA